MHCVYVAVPCTNMARICFASGRSRSCDLTINSRMLYQLSYRSMVCVWKELNSPLTHTHDTYTVFLYILFMESLTVCIYCFEQGSILRSYDYYSYALPTKLSKQCVYVGDEGGIEPPISESTRSVQ